VLNLSSEDIEIYPTPHIVQHEIFDGDFYRELERNFPETDKFPINKEGDWYRMSRDLIRGDDAYTELINNSKAWAKLYHFINS